VVGRIAALKLGLGRGIMAEWQNGRMAEWQNGRMADFFNENFANVNGS
jgi:hypothetical protein